MAPVTRRWNSGTLLTPRGTLDTVAGIAIAVAMAVGFFLIVAGTRPLDFDYMVRSFWVLLPSLGLSAAITFAAFFLGLPIGFIVGWARTLRSRRWEHPARRGVKHVAARIADGYVEVMRGTPLFVQIIFAWSALGIKAPSLPNLAFVAGLIAMTGNTGGYQGEIFRGGLQTVHSGQVEAARSIGLTRWGAMRHVVLPQALRLTIPPLLNELIGLFKASSLLFFIGVAELTFRYKQLANFEARIFELFAVVTLLYLLFTLTVSKGVEYLERRYRIPGLGVGGTRESFAAKRVARRTAL